MAAPVDLPTDRPRPAVRTHRGAVLDAPLGNLRQRVIEFARSRVATPQMVYLAAFQVLISRMTASTDILVAVPTETRDGAEAQATISNCSNTVIVRSRLAEARTFSDVLVDVRRATGDALAHRRLPYAELVADLERADDAARPARASLQFGYNDLPVVFPRFGGHDTTRLVVDRGGAQFDLSIEVPVAP